MTAAMAAEGDKAAVFERHRRRLFSLAYRMLGLVGDAEDAVQDAYLRWHRTDVASIQNPEAWLVTACTRICIDRLRQARIERQNYTGPWLPEPLIELEVQPEDPAGTADDLSMALLVVLERLTPAERAAWLLREAFDYDYPQIAAVLQKSEAACRQLVSRAAKHIRDEKPRFAADDAAVRRLTETFAAATRAGDAAAFAGLLAEDAMLWSDGGGKAAAALNVIHGADRIARFFAGVAPKQPKTLRRITARINGQPGWLLLDGQKPYLALALDIADGLVRNVFIMRNPDKLARLPAM
ncbi:MAG TPA: RNA polymerase sigma factor SigJ [Ferrovibrio sp.]|uniref:RNA polymerase sigma factor SigJ n=1 Tax=Ferrovibrio sp. TaxID=1917215 RepID=UPI002B4B49C0|nr:RNA polymerase sigma factor SigJ [Ferrovibrio sp.]HLT76305.1 RNA polymerase sigma factor SigJ [Ferrovibrio sp.]